jgi:Phage capsid protein
MAVQQEFWKREIITRLPMANPHLGLCVNADSYVLGGKVVHIPQAGAVNPTIINPTYPLTTVQRADTDVTYALDLFAKPVTAITDLEQAEISYAKMESVMDQDFGSLLEDVGTWLTWRWCDALPTTNLFRVATTGANRAAGAPGATGNRKAMVRNEIIAAKTAMDLAKIPESNRYMMLSPNHIADLLTEDAFKNYYNTVVNVASGTIPSFYGFRLLMRQTTLRTDAAGAVKSPTSANAATDHEASVFWHTSMVEKAVGEVNVYQRINDPEWQGDLVSFSVRNGGRRRRADNVGVVLVVDALGA